MDEDVQRARLDSARRFATAQLLGILLLMVLAIVIREHPASSWLLAFAEAALIGGLADWFAVTALFRHPLGLRIPHTAIIPSNRERLADGIAQFLEQNFLTPRVLQRELASMDTAAMMGHWLSSPVHRRWLVRQVLRRGDDYFQTGPLLAQTLLRLIEQGRHEYWFDRLLNGAMQALVEQQPAIYQKVVEKSPRWMPRRLNEEFFQRLLSGLAELLAELQPPDSPARRQFARMLTGLAEQWERSEGIAASMEGLLGTRRIQHHLETQLAQLAQRLMQDPALRSGLNRRVREQLMRGLLLQRHQISGLVRRVVISWDERSLVERIELKVGRDLQFIRMNGTLVGGLIGLLIFAIRQLAGSV